MARLAALFVALAASVALVAAQDCPISPATTPLDFSGVKTGCAAGPETFCANCTCSLIAAFLPAFTAANLTINPADTASYPVDKASGVISACGVAYSSGLVSAGVSLASLASLGSCEFNNSATLPPCILQLLSSTDLVALLSADQAAVLKAAAAENLDSIPALVEYVGTLTNPINATALIEKISALTAAAPKADLPSAAGCPISPDTTTLDFDGVPAACAADSPLGSFCSNCSCALVSAFLPAFKAANLTIDPANPAAYPVAKAAAATAACSVAYTDSLTAAGVEVSAIARLANCTFTSAEALPPCLVTLLSPAAAASPSPAPVASPSPSPAPAAAAKNSASGRMAGAAAAFFAALAAVAVVL
ncbi:hypothetical protein MNEG_4043 [Monoraphidium neglectum]|uniref:Uncharacterized protein n=1 Tax=Monoraphidium neglectum TaxID=145388 RepID=A0A0D2MM69_9CHLO|nr:hypothetical protein MNEG_4043 [Monoraphidium neglectum]KIZ03915.1 hypothetical protein MNEG_4043 [Monoraphidium neglectum]|eukprot:XP_013902934.1 hypothetical protein MNEG_4043 [Monoraphidium neglectum]